MSLSVTPESRIYFVLYTCYNYSVDSARLTCPAPAGSLTRYNMLAIGTQGLSKANLRVGRNQSQALFQFRPTFYSFCGVLWCSYRVLQSLILVVTCISADFPHSARHQRGLRALHPLPPQPLTPVPRSFIWALSYGSCGFFHPVRDFAHGSCGFRGVGNRGRRNFLWEGAFDARRGAGLW